ncbi:MAG: hypothetical protein IH934_01605 [Nanoarchaeota archaeon]|nr:hypothetical protein [Nanoarchaeota archaeon]
MGALLKFLRFEPKTTFSPVPAPGFEDVPEMIVQEEFVEDEHETSGEFDPRTESIKRSFPISATIFLEEDDILFTHEFPNEGSLKGDESEIFVYNDGQETITILRAKMELFTNNKKSKVNSGGIEKYSLRAWDVLDKINFGEEFNGKYTIEPGTKGKMHWHYFTSESEDQTVNIIIDYEVGSKKVNIDKELIKDTTKKVIQESGSDERHEVEVKGIIKKEKIYRIELPTEDEMTLLPECDDKLFTTFPVDMNEVESITPLGNLGPPGHTFPTQHPHIHLGVYETSYAYPLYAPADVYITSVAWSEGATQDPVDYVIYFALCKDIIGYYNHVKTLSNEVKDIIEKVECESFSTDSEGSCTKVLLDKVDEGTLLGEVGLKQGNFDFGLIDLRKPLDFIKPERYPTRDQYLNCAFDYYPENMKQQFYGLINRVDGTCGIVMQDVPNTLKGNWFHETSPKKYVVDWNVYLAFVDHFEDPSIQVVSIAGIFTEPSLFKFIPKQSGAINREFSQVTADGTIYCYEGANVIRDFETVPSGKILVEMTGDETLQIERQSGSCSGSESFKNPEIYNR